VRIGTASYRLTPGHRESAGTIADSQLKTASTRPRGPTWTMPRFRSTSATVQGQELEQVVLGSPGESGSRAVRASTLLATTS